MDKPTPARSGLVVIGAAALVACGEPCPPAGGPGVRFDPTAQAEDGSAESWLAFPFPADHRRTEAGTVRLDDYPNPSDTELVRTYARYGEEVLDGFGTNGPIYLAFTDGVDLTSLPAAPGDALAADAALQLVDVDSSSPEYGRRRPLHWEYWPVAGRYVAAQTLAVAPAWGTPLRERTTYALLVTRAARAADGAPLVAPPLLRRLLGEEVSADCVVPPVRGSAWRTLDQAFAPLRRWLGDDLDGEAIVAATVFTTQTVTAELAAVYAQLAATPAPVAGDWQLLAAPSYARRETFQWTSSATVDYWILEGRYASPNYQWGQLPYAGPRDGGGFQSTGGAPAPSRTETLRFVLSVPVAAPVGGAGCHPLVEVAHGTGGDAYSFTRDGTAGRLAARGLAGIGIDQPLHGPRGEGGAFNVELMTFNPINPAAARAIFRQSAIDTFALTRMLSAGLRVPAAQSPTGSELCFAAAPSFFGHSQGGLSGALAAAFATEIDAWVLSGAGGGLAMTLTQRKDLLDFEAFLALLLYLEPTDEPLSELHPAVGLIQTLMDVTDPINYAPHWLTGAGPKSVLMTSGEHDAATPYLTASALAVAGRVPVVEPVAIPIPAYAWIDLPPVAAPVSGNAGEGTAGFLQWTSVYNRPDYDSHFVIFHRPEAIHASMRFLESAALTGTPVIERQPSIDVR